MAVRVHIQADSRAVRRAFERLVRAGRNPRPVLGRIGLYVRRDAQRRLRSRKRSWGASSGRLSRSLAMRLGDAEVVVGSDLVYAAVQQLGHPGIRPKGGRTYLAIPALASLRRRGVWPRDLPRGSMKFVRAARIRIGSHTWTGPALVRADAGSAAGPGQRAAAEKTGEVMFALVRRVRIKGDPYLVFDRPAQQFALNELARAYTRAWKG